MQLARVITDRLVNNTPKEITVQEIKKAVCQYFDIAPDVLLSKHANVKFVKPDKLPCILAETTPKIPYLPLDR